MPGFNKQGPDGAGTGTGRQRGLCRRTENKPFVDDAGFLQKGRGSRSGSGQGRGQGQRCRFPDAAGSGPDLAPETVEELRKLKEEYLAAQKSLSLLEEKIIALEGRKQP